MRLLARLITAVVLIGIAAAAAVGVWSFFGNYYSDQTKICTVNDKDRSVSRNSDGAREVQMMIYTDECGVFEVGDSLVKGQWRSGDLYGKIQIGHKYEFKYHGFRNGFLSMFPTITEAKEIA